VIFHGYNTDYAMIPLAFDNEDRGLPSIGREHHHAANLAIRRGSEKRREGRRRNLRDWEGRRRGRWADFGRCAVGEGYDEWMEVEKEI
jgi:hypothetical protein